MIPRTEIGDRDDDDDDEFFMDLTLSIVAFQVWVFLSVQQLASPLMISKLLTYRYEKIQQPCLFSLLPIIVMLMVSTRSINSV